jgi:hypothetical protein
MSASKPNARAEELLKVLCNWTCRHAGFGLCWECVLPRLEAFAQAEREDEAAKFRLSEAAAPMFDFLEIASSARDQMDVYIRHHMAIAALFGDEGVQCDLDGLVELVRQTKERAEWFARDKRAAWEQGRDAGRQESREMLEQAERERDEWKEMEAQRSADLKATYDTANVLQAKLYSAQEALKKFGMHKRGCTAIMSSGSCSCGLAEALKC